MGGEAQTPLIVAFGSPTNGSPRSPKFDLELLGRIHWWQVGCDVPTQGGQAQQSPLGLESSGRHFCHSEVWMKSGIFL